MYVHIHCVLISQPIIFSMETHRTKIKVFFLLQEKGIAYPPLVTDLIAKTL